MWSWLFMWWFILCDGIVWDWIEIEIGFCGWGIRLLIPDPFVFGFIDSGVPMSKVIDFKVPRLLQELTPFDLWFWIMSTCRQRCYYILQIQPPISQFLHSWHTASFIWSWHPGFPTPQFSPNIEKFSIVAYHCVFSIGSTVWRYRLCYDSWCIFL